MPTVHALSAMVQQLLPPKVLVNQITETTLLVEYLEPNPSVRVVFRVCRSPDTRLSYPRFTFEGVTSEMSMSQVYREHRQDVVLYFCCERGRWYFIDFLIGDFQPSAYVWDEQGKVNRVVVRIPADRMRSMFVPVEGVETETLIPGDTERGNGSLAAVLRWYLLRGTKKGMRA